MNDIGEGAIIKAGTVVTQNVPPHIFFGEPNVIALARVTVPLTLEHSYQEFIQGLKPIKGNTKL